MVQMLEIHSYFTLARLKTPGKQLQLLLQRLHNEVGMQYDDVHIIGHSLGAHAAGYAGALLGGQIGRISGICRSNTK